ncbi:MAG: M42 family peptidase [Acholeplasmatales bacterium]|nr:MAG: M42 family peptidase [Acholeplasmatales bacterium]
MRSILEELSMLPGIPGNESAVRHYMKEQFEGHGTISQDNLGSIIVEKVGLKGGPRIMVAGHMDEVGFMVTRITEEGYVKFIPAGGWWSQVMLAQQMEIHTADGKKLRAVTGAKAPHILTEEERKKPVAIEDMYLDLGVADKDEAEALGIKTGDMIVPYIQTTPLNNPKYWLGKAWDNRVGCAAVIDVLHTLKAQAHPNIYYGVGTVQEEVGLRGAGTSAYHVNPDIGIAVDTTIAYDFPKGSKDTELGKGVGVMVADSSMVGHKGMRDFVIAVAEKNNIPLQLTHLTRGGTDGGKIHLSRSGVPSIALCLPVRYLHSHTSIVHQDDYDNLVKLIRHLVEALDAEAVQKITYG